MVTVIIWKRSVWVLMSTLKRHLKFFVSFWGSIHGIRSFVSKNSGSIGIWSALISRLARKSFWIARNFFWKNRDLREIVFAWDLGNLRIVDTLEIRATLTKFAQYCSRAISEFQKFCAFQPMHVMNYEFQKLQFLLNYILLSSCHYNNEFRHLT